MTETSEDDYIHAGCQAAYERETKRWEHAEARLDALIVAFRQLASVMDSIDSHNTHDDLGSKTLGGAIRWTLSQQ